MPVPRPLYLVVSGVVLAALVGSALLVWTYRPPSETGTSNAPTPTAAATGTGSAPSHQPTQPTPTAAPSPTPSPTSALVKEVQPQSAEPEDLTGYIWPTRHALITSRFAPRDFGSFLLLDGEEVHDGLDIATHCGNKVRAAHDGTVLYAGRNFDPYFGYWGDAEAIYARLERLGRVNDQPIVVVIDDGNGYRSVYVHLQRADVEAGVVVKAGDFIGLEGATGFATGCHLHYGMIRMDSGWQDLVPRLEQFGYPLKVRERIDPLRVLPWGDPDAPQRLQDRVNGTPPPSPSASPWPSPSPSPIPELPNQ